MERAHLAVCVAGQLRSATCEWRGSRYAPPALSIRDHLLSPLKAAGAAVDVFAALDAPPQHSPLPGDSVTALKSILDILQPVQALFLDEAGDEQLYSRMRHELLPGEGNASACGLLSTRLARLLSFNSIAQSRKLGACWQMILARESTVRKAPYSHVIRVRPLPPP